jgi:hypothetical protein
MGTARRDCQCNTSRMSSCASPFTPITSAISVSCNCEPGPVAAYRLDQSYRTAHHGGQVIPSTTWGMVAHEVTRDGAPSPAKDRSGLVLENGGLRITAIEVDHAPIEPAYAYRFDYKGRSAIGRATRPCTHKEPVYPPTVFFPKPGQILLSAYSDCSEPNQILTSEVLQF